MPTIDLAANIVNLGKAAGLSVDGLQMVFGFNSPQTIYKTIDNLVVLAALLHVWIGDDLMISRGVYSPIWSTRLVDQGTDGSRL